MARCLALLLMLGQLALLSHRTEHAIDAAPDGHAAACVFCIPVIDPPAAPFVEPPARQTVVLVALPFGDSPAPVMRARLGFRSHAPPTAISSPQQELNDIA